MTTEKMCNELCVLWANALGIDMVSPDDDFFDLGGNSIVAIRMLKEISRICGVEPSAAAIFDNPTPRELASALSDIALEHSTK